MTAPVHVGNPSLVDSTAAILKAWGDKAVAGDMLAVDKVRAWSGDQRVQATGALQVCGEWGSRKMTSALVMVPWDALADRVDTIQTVVPISSSTVALAVVPRGNVPALYSPILATAKLGGRVLDMKDVADGELIGPAADRLGATMVVRPAGLLGWWDGPPPTLARTVVIVGPWPVTDLERRMVEAWAPGADVVSVFELRQTGPIAASRGPVPWGVVGKPIVEVDAVTGPVGERIKKMARIRSKGARGWSAATGDSIATPDGWAVLPVPSHLDYEGRLVIEIPARRVMTWSF